MRALGISVAPSGARGRPVAHAVLLEGARSAPRVVEAFHVRAGDVPKPEQIVEVARGMASKCAELVFDDVVVRVADAPPVASRRNASALRANIEGAVILALRSRLDHAVIMRNGQELGTACGTSKADVLARGRLLVPDAQDAAAAALSALPDA